MYFAMQGTLVRNSLLFSNYEPKVKTTHFYCHYYYYYYYIITFKQGIYDYIHETNHAARVYSVASATYLQFVLHVMLLRMLRMFCAFTFVLSEVCV
jgi:hypothetical protein